MCEFQEARWEANSCLAGNGNVPQVLMPDKGLRQSPCSRQLPRTTPSCRVPWVCPEDPS